MTHCKPITARQTRSNMLFFQLQRSKLEGNGPIDEGAAMMVVSETNFDLRFEFSNLNYPGSYVHVASNSLLGGLWGHGGLQMTSEAKSDLRF